MSGSSSERSRRPDVPSTVPSTTLTTVPSGGSAAPSPDDPSLDLLVGDLAARIRRTLGVELASIAVVGEDGSFRMTEHDGANSPLYRQLQVRPGAGLGGLVVELDRPVRLGDYLADDRITDDYRAAVLDEGLRGLACVPVRGPGGTTLLLYAGNRETDSLGDRALGRLEGLAAATEVDIERIRSGLPPGQTAPDAAVLAERRRLAAELHDSVAQVLFAIAVDAELPGQSKADHVRALERIADLARTGRTGLRRTFAALAKGVEAAGDLATRLTATGERIGRECGITVTWLVRQTPNLLPRAVTDLLDDALREGLRNAAKHARVDSVLATLSGPDEDNPRIALTLQMDGAMARALEEGEAGTPGSGLHMLRERAIAAGGSVRIWTITDDGEPVIVQRIELPLLTGSADE